MSEPTADQLQQLADKPSFEIELGPRLERLEHQVSQLHANDHDLLAWQADELRKQQEARDVLVRIVMCLAISSVAMLCLRKWGPDVVKAAIEGAMRGAA